MTASPRCRQGTRFSWVLAAGLLLASITVPSAMAAGVGQASPSAGRLDVVFRHDGDGTGTDANRDSIVWLTRTNGTWGTPVNIGGSLNQNSDIGIVSRQANNLDIAVRWSDNSLRVRHWSTTTGWQDWVNLAGSVTGGPSLAAQGPNDMTLAYRDTGGFARIRTWNSTTGWSDSAALSTTPKVGTGPAIISPKPGVLDLLSLRPSDGVVVMRTLTAGAPTLDKSWGTSQYFSKAALTADSSPAAAARGQLNAKATDALVLDVAERRASSRGLYTLTPAGWLSAATTIAPSTTPRAGESTLANTPAASWSNRLTTSSAQLDVTIRREDGCIYGRSKTATTDWTATARIPTVPYANARCTWPGRTVVNTSSSRVPLAKRADPADNDGLKQAHDAWLYGASNRSALNWYTSRDQALILHDGPDWPTSWAPRNWHPNTWVYRKSTSFLGSDGLQNVSPTSSYFVRLKGSGDLAAVNYACGSGGCTQPLLDVTSAAARNYWLRGPDGVAPTKKSTNCTDYGAHGQDGVLDQLACGYEGVWLDDVLAELGSSGGSTGESHVADDVTGAPLNNGQLLTMLPFTQAQWENGLATMIEDLRAGISTLKSQGVLAQGAGAIASNYKWNSYGFAEAYRTGSAPTISATSATGRIIKASSLIELEGGWIDNGLVPGDPSQDWSFGRRQRFVDQVHGLGGHVLEEKTNSADIPEYGNQSCLLQLQTQSSATNAADYTTAQYNLGATLLNWTPGDWVGDICDVYGRGWDGYATDLGAPLASREALSNGLQRRQFEGGWVLVAPPGKSGTVALPSPMYMRPNGVDSQTRALVTSVTLSQRQAAVLQRP